MDKKLISTIFVFLLVTQLVLGACITETGLKKQIENKIEDLGVEATPKLVNEIFDNLRPQSNKEIYDITDNLEISSEEADLQQIERNTQEIDKTTTSLEQIISNNKNSNLLQKITNNKIQKQKDLTSDLEKAVLSDYIWQKNKISYHNDIIKLTKGQQLERPATLYHKAGKTYKAIFQNNDGTIQISTIDIQDFKHQINERYGHDLGDLFLQVTAQKLDDLLNKWDGSNPTTYLKNNLNTEFKNSIINNVKNNFDFIVDTPIKKSEIKGQQHILTPKEFNFYTGVSQKSIITQKNMQKLNDQSVFAGKTAQLSDIGQITDFSKINEKQLAQAKTKEKTAIREFTENLPTDFCCDTLRPAIIQNEYNAFGEKINPVDIESLFQQRKQALNQNNIKLVNKLNNKIWESTLRNSEFGNFLDGNDIFKLSTNKLLDSQGKEPFAETFIVGGDEIGFIISGRNKIRFARVDINNFGATGRIYGNNFADIVKTNILQIIQNNIQKQIKNPTSNAELSKNINLEVLNYIKTTNKEFNPKLEPSLSIGIANIDKNFNQIDATKLNEISNKASEEIKAISKAKITKTKTTRDIINEGGFFKKADIEFEKLSDLKPNDISDLQWKWIKDEASKNIESTIIFNKNTNKLNLKEKEFINKIDEIRKSAKC